MSDDTDDTRKIVLARRARFLAAAVAGVGIAACGEPPAPQVCLSTVPVNPPPPDEPGPQVCLSPMPTPEDAGPGDTGASTPIATDTTPVDAGSSPDAGAGKKKPPPTSVVPTAKPMPCLTPMPPKPPRKP